MTKNLPTEMSYWSCAPLRAHPRKAVTTAEPKVWIFQVFNFQYQSALRESLKFMQPEAALPKPLSSVMLWQQAEQRWREKHINMRTVLCHLKRCNLSRSLVLVRFWSLFFSPHSSFFAHHRYAFSVLPWGSENYCRGGWQVCALQLHIHSP